MRNLLVPDIFAKTCLPLTGVRLSFEESCENDCYLKKQLQFSKQANIETKGQTNK